MNTELIQKCTDEILRCQNECAEMHKGIRAIIGNEEFVRKMVELRKYRKEYGRWYYEGDRAFTYVDGNHRSNEEYKVQSFDEIRQSLEYYWTMYNEIESLGKAKEFVVYYRTKVTEYKQFCQDIGKVVAWAEEEYAKIKAQEAKEERSLIEELGL